MEEYLGIKIDLEKDALFDDLGIKRLKESYILFHTYSFIWTQ